MKSIATQTIFSITESRITAFVVVVYARSYSHRTRASRRDVGCVCVASLSSIVLNRMGACNQGKSVLAAYCVSSLVDTRSVLTGDLKGKKRARIHRGHCDSC